MAHSLEVRVPSLDVVLAEFAYGLPGESKLGAGSTPRSAEAKRVLIHAVRDLIPDWTYRKSKRGFSFPFDEWLRGPLGLLAEETLGGAVFRESGLVDGGEAIRVWREFQAGRRVHWSRVWSLLVVALWWNGHRAQAVRAASHGNVRRPWPANYGATTCVGGG